MLLKSIWESVAKAFEELTWIKEIAKKQLMVRGVHVWKISEIECIELGNTQFLSVNITITLMITKGESQESESEVSQSCRTLCSAMDCSLPDFSIRGIFQARVPEWVAISFTRGSSWPRDQTQVFHFAGIRLSSDPPGNHRSHYRHDQEKC